jgi:hypothetical protein
LEHVLLGIISVGLVGLFGEEPHHTSSLVLCI